jgi:DNA-binding MarR family transcriptional regulator
LSDPQYQALAEFRRHIRRFLYYSEQAAREHGLEPQQHQFLLAVKGLPAGVAATIREIASRLEVRHHTAVELAKRMEARGLVTRRMNPLDRREVLITVTAAGENALRGLTLAHRTELQKMGPELMKALKKVLKNS